MLRSEISKVINRPSSSAQVVCDTDFDPSPYDISCEKICLILGFGPNDFNVFNSVLSIEGSSAALKNLSDNLPCDSEEYDGTLQYHCHYDMYSFPDFVSSRSPEVVLSLAP
ncbi:MAG: hypothetical protein F6K09_14935 [Merismopedia sp. SIO2A8]|nr:hypothetical protein [Symploca sp. SIO2B6]NET49979.1 hypothetical protein [Merismopedia sp. SIO2A8]